MTRFNSAPASWQRGRTIVELMVALTIGLVVLGALLLVYLSSSSSGRQTQTVERMNEDGAIALHLLASQLRLAGFSYPRLNVPPVSATFNGLRKQLPDRYLVGAGLRGCDRGFVNAAASFSELECATSGTASAAIAVRFEGDANNTVPNKAGVATDCVGQKAPDAPAATGGGVSYLLVESRFWTRTSSGIGVPELACGGNGGNTSATANTFSPKPLVQLVESIALRYGLADDDIASSSVRYVDAATVDALGGSVDANWSRVVSVQVCVLVRSEERDNTGSGGYVGCNGQTAVATDGYTRRAYRTVVALRNRAGFAQGVAG
ncbi:MAG: PilW family protein [Proteobacteria bacterium]|nr:PilW family protein [Pseudomonadota bacterium]